MADLCLVSHAAGYRVFKGTIDNHPTVKRIARPLHGGFIDRFASRAAAAPAGRAWPRIQRERVNAISNTPRLRSCLQRAGGLRSLAAN